MSDLSELRIWAAMLDDTMRARIAAGNRAERGSVHPDLYAAHRAALEEAEHQCSLQLGRAFRRLASPGLVAWQKATVGIGEHLLARLVGQIGHPRIAEPYTWMAQAPEDHVCGGTCKKDDEGKPRHLVALPSYERTVSQLWSYCGIGDPARRKVKGMSADDAMGLGRPLAKMLVHLLAESCIKQVGSEARPATEPKEGSPLTHDEEDDGANVHPKPMVNARRSSSKAQTDEANTQSKPNDPAPHSAEGGDDDGVIGLTDTNEGSPRRRPPSRRSPYRDVYDSARVLYASRVHAEPCIRCGPSGHPAAEGSPWSIGHQHAAALRKVGKEIVKDMWIASGPGSTR